ncbi:MAG: ribulose-phosphate 3-epimerase, partial [Nanoarchaeota archaeon]
LDTVLVMTVKTGYAGQPFMDMTDKIRKLVKIRTDRGLDFEIEADGGVNDKTVGLLREAGCDAVNSASYILNNDFERAVRVLKGI